LLNWDDLIKLVIALPFKSAMKGFLGQEMSLRLTHTLLCHHQFPQA
jgi:hypothetical protein